MGKNRLRKIKSIRVVYTYTLVILLILPSFAFTFEFIIKSDGKESKLNLNYTLCFEKPVLKELTLNGRTFSQIHIPNCLSYAALGDPALPTFPVKILLPQGKTVSKVDASYCKMIELNYNLSEKPIIPQQKPISLGADEDNVSFQMNKDVYNSTNPVFDTIYKNGSIGFCKGFAVFTINLFPVQYIPKTGKIYYFPKMNINIEFKEDKSNILKKSSLMFRYNNYDLNTIKNLVVDPDVANTYSPSPLSKSNGEGLCNSSDTYEYVIITNEALNNTAGQYNWSDLLNHRRTYSGLNTTKVTVENIYNCSAYWNDTVLFNDSAAKIREFIKDAYRNWNTRYVVLGGDWDINNESRQIVPARIFVEYNSYINKDDYYSMPCDMYYSNLDGNWRDSIHNCWGGGKNSSANDDYAEVNVGRMTVSTPTELSNFMKKIIWYDSTDDNDFMRKSVFFGGGSWI